MSDIRKNNMLPQIRELIVSKLGLHFPDEKQGVLFHNLSLAAKELGFHDNNHLTEKLLTDKLNKKDIGILASYLTVSETFFWRESMVFSALTDFILPEILASRKNGDKNIRIWSAGCSSGEEPYSLAIAVCKAIPDLENWNISILASDINSKALSKAKEGKYGPWSFRNCPQWLMDSYFIRRDNRIYEIRPEIRKMVTFVNLNLAEDDYPSPKNNTNAMDIIFCRNVLMYFTDEWINKISRKLYQSIKKDGWLSVASCELSSLTFSRFTPVNFPGAILYRKSKKDLLASPYPEPKQNEISYSSPAIKSNWFQVPETEILQPVETGEETIKKKISEEKYPSEKIETGKNTGETNIRLLADQGKLTEALTACNQKIELNKLDKNLYFLRASILQELKRTDDSITSLKQTIYLDPDFIMAHFTLGNLYLRNSQPKYARKHFQNVLALLNSFSDADIIPESEGLLASHIRGIIQDNLKKEI